jgi:hypothetical protein
MGLQPVTKNRDRKVKEEEKMELTAFPAPMRFLAMEEFDRMRTRAQLDQIHHWLTAKPGQLESLSALLPAQVSTRRYRGIREIPVGKITGSVDRSQDFDRDFRPLKKHLRDRWVGMYLLAEQGNWPPIRVYKIGERYYVEDGHHRVSVARAQGMVSIPAEVWEYIPGSIPAESMPPAGRYCGLPCIDWPAEECRLSMGGSQ